MNKINRNEVDILNERYLDEFYEVYGGVLGKLSRGISYYIESDVLKDYIRGEEIKEERSNSGQETVEDKMHILSVIRPNDEIVKYLYAMRDKVGPTPRLFGTNTVNSSDNGGSIYGVYGDVTRIGDGWDIRIKEEMDELVFTNEAMSVKMADICSLVKVSQINIPYNETSTIVEFDALLVRYANTLTEEEFKALIISLSGVVASRVIMYVYRQHELNRLIDRHVGTSLLSDNLSHDWDTRNSRIGAGLTTLRNIYKICFILKAMADDINDVVQPIGMEDFTKTIDLAMSMLDDKLFSNKNGTREVNTLLGNKIYLDGYITPEIDSILRTIENTTGRYELTTGQQGGTGYIGTLGVSNLDIIETLHSVTRHRVNMHSYENAVMLYQGLLGSTKLANEDVNMINRGVGKYSFTGMLTYSGESTNMNKSRGILLGKLNSALRNYYIDVENSILKYAASAVAVTDNSKRNSLLASSRYTGKLINLYIEKYSENESFIELMAALEEERHNIDLALSKRDLNKERNNKMYGYVTTSSKWNY